VEEEPCQEVVVAQRSNLVVEEVVLNPSCCQGAERDCRDDEDELSVADRRFLCRFLTINSYGSLSARAKRAGGISLDDSDRPFTC
jgi:hypothetical protein